jgi:hypothetical protein
MRTNTPKAPTAIKAAGVIFRFFDKGVTTGMNKPANIPIEQRANQPMVYRKLNL